MRYISLVFFFLSSIPCNGQEESSGVVIDKIISKIDDYIVLKSELESTYLDVLSRGQRLSGNTKCAVLKNLITNKLLVAKAEINSVMVEDSEVNQELDSRMNIIINQVGSEEEIENFYNKTISEFKNELFDDIKQQLVANKMRREILSDISVSPEEVRGFFNNIPKDSIPYFLQECDFRKKSFHILQFPDLHIPYNGDICPIEIPLFPLDTCRFPIFVLILDFQS